MTWRRPYAGAIQNPLASSGGKAGISFHEEDVVRIGSKVISTKSTDPAGLRVEFVEGETFPLLDPETDEVAGTMTPEAFYAAARSLYRAAALARDAREAQEAAAVDSEGDSDSEGEGEGE